MSDRVDATPIDVFISYAKVDGAAAQELAEALKSRGHSVFLDASLPPGESWRESIQSTIGNSSIFVPLISQRSLRSNWNQSEIELAVALDRPVVPVILDNEVNDRDAGMWRRYRAIRLTDTRGGIESVASLLSDTVEVWSPSRPEWPLVSPEIPTIGDSFIVTENYWRLLEALRSNEQLVVVTGTGGSGKTTVASAVARRLAEELDIIWWVNGSVPSAIEASAAELEAQLVRSDRTSIAGALMSAVVRLNESNRTWLLVLDDIPPGYDIHSVATEVRRQGSGKLLITSRTPLDLRLEQIDLQITPLTDHEAEELFARVLQEQGLGKHSIASHESVKEVTGGLPLAVSLLASTSSRSSRTDSARSISDLVNELVSISLSRLNDLFPEAQNLLAVMGWMGAASPLPIEVIAQAADDAYLQSTRSRVFATLREMARLQLLDLSGSSLQVHPLIQANLRNTDLEAGLFFAKALRAGFLSNDIDKSGRECLVLHSEALLERFIAPGHSDSGGSVGDEGAIWELLTLTVQELLDSGRPQQGIQLAERVSEGLAGARSFSETTGEAQLILGDAYLAAGRLEDAIARYEQYLSTSSASDPAPLPQRSRARVNLAEALRLTGRYLESSAVAAETLSESERILGPDDPSTLAAATNLADSLLRRGDTESAATFYRRVLADSERTLGPDHPSTLWAATNLASSLTVLGDDESAMALYRRVLADSERMQGLDHPSTLAAATNLAASLARLDHNESAMALYQRVLADSERILGPDDPSTLSAATNLAGFLTRIGDSESAATLYQEVLARSERRLGPDHPLTREIRNRAQLVES